VLTSRSLHYPNESCVSQPAETAHAQVSNPALPATGSGTCASGASASGIAVQAKPRLQRGPSAMAPVRREKRLTTCLRAQTPGTATICSVSSQHGGPFSAGAPGLCQIHLLCRTAQSTGGCKRKGTASSARRRACARAARCSRAGRHGVTGPSARPERAAGRGSSSAHIRLAAAGLHHPCQHARGGAAPDARPGYEVVVQVPVSGLVRAEPVRASRGGSGHRASGSPAQVSPDCKPCLYRILVPQSVSRAGATR